MVDFVPSVGGQLVSIKSVQILYDQNGYPEGCSVFGSRMILMKYG